MRMGNTRTRVIDRPSEWNAAREQLEIDSWESRGWELHKILPDRLYFKIPEEKAPPRPPAVRLPRYGDRRFNSIWNIYEKWNGYSWVRDTLGSPLRL